MSQLAGDSPGLVVARDTGPSWRPNAPAADTLPRESRKPAAIIRATISSWILFIVSALAPLPLGSNEPISIAIWCIVLGACVIIAPVPVLRPPQLGLVALSGVIIVAYAFVLHEQLAVHPWLAAPHPIWHQAEQALGTPLVGSVSIARNQPLFDLGRPLVCMLAITAGFLVGCDRQARPAIDEDHRLVGRDVCGIRRHRPSFRPDAHSRVREAGVSRCGDRHFCQPQYRRGLFRIVRGDLVGTALGRECGAKCRRGRSIGAQYRNAFTRGAQNEFSSQPRWGFFALWRCS